MMTLEALAARYALERDIEPGTLEWLRVVVRRFSAHLGRPATVDDLDEDQVNAWLTALLAAGKSRVTVKGYRGALLMLWRMLAENGERKLPERLRRVKAPKPIPCAWSMAQVAALLCQASAMVGYYDCGIKRSVYWRSVILALWDSGVRIGDLLKLQWSDVAESGMVVIRQKKTQWPLTFRFSERTLGELQSIRMADRTLIFGEVVGKDWFFQTFKKIVSRAGLSGGTKKIRKSAATAVEAMRPGAATEFLGHKTPNMARDHYIDPRLLPMDRPAPPPLPETA